MVCKANMGGRAQRSSAHSGTPVHRHWRLGHPSRAVLEALHIPSCALWGSQGGAGGRGGGLRRHLSQCGRLPPLWRCCYAA